MTLLLLACAAALAGWSGEAGLGTEVPADIGVRLGVESPQRVRLGFGAGVLPGPYLDLTNAAVVALGGYDQTTADVIRSALRSSLVLTARLGWRPFQGAGFRFSAGWRLVALGGSATGEDIVAAATGQEVPETRLTAHAREFLVSSTLHMAVLEAGWQWTLHDRLLLAAGLGGMFTLAAKSTVEPDFDPILDEAMEAFTAEGAAYLDGLYTGWVHSPTLLVEISYRLP